MADLSNERRAVASSRLLLYLLTAAIAAVIAVATVVAQERVDSDTYWKIRREAQLNSQILKTLHMLTDVYGPRLTGSPNLKSAGEWAIQHMTSWGLQNGHLEA